MDIDRKDHPAPAIEFLLEPRGEKLSAETYRRHEAAQIAARIQQMCAAPDPLKVGEDRPANYGDVALLFRAMGEVYLYEEALRRAGVPYALLQGRGFYRKQEILDLHNLLRLVVDPWNEAALLAFLRGPLACLSDETLYWLARGPQTLPEAFHSGMVPPEVREPEPLAAARHLLAEARERKDMPLPEYLQWLLECTGLEAVVLSQYHGVQNAANLRKLVQLAVDFSRRRPPSLFAFVEYLNEVGGDEIREGEAAVQPEGSGAVTLMTIHQSKGLEFPIVFVPDTGRKHGGSNPGGVVLHRELGMAMRSVDPVGAIAKPAIFGAIERRK